MNAKIDFPLPTDLPRPTDGGAADRVGAFLLAGSEVDHLAQQQNHSERSAAQ
jgi:hypothetical protein